MFAPTASADSVTDAIARLQVPVTELGKPLAAPLNNKLTDASAAYQAGDTAGACSDLKSFINQLAGQAGKKNLSLQTAQSLIAETIFVEGLLGGC
ncbi:MAG TPA: hypothetical protein VGP69_13965 [Gaiellaceae bacterium]|nr:hypothetical protein [Gaiellaceae bacterium]